MKQKEWLDQIVAQQTKAKAAEAEKVVESTTATIQEVSDNESQKSAVELEDILMDEGKVTEAMKKITKEEIRELGEAVCE